MIAPLAELEQLCRELEQAERAAVRVAGLCERTADYEKDCRVLAAEIAAKARELNKVNRGLLGLWLWARNERSERMTHLGRSLAQLEQRRSLKMRLIAETNAEVTEVKRTHGHGLLEDLRTRFEHAARSVRAAMSVQAPERSAELRELELDLADARRARDAAALALRQQHEVVRALEAAQIHLEDSLRGLVTHARYPHVRRALHQLEAADRIIGAMRALDAVRDELGPLAPDVEKALRADEIAVERAEESLEAVQAARKLFADLAPQLAAQARTTQNQAGSLERRVRSALVAARALLSF